MLHVFSIWSELSKHTHMSIRRWKHFMKPTSCLFIYLSLAIV